MCSGYRAAGGHMRSCGHLYSSVLGCSPWTVPKQTVTPPRACRLTSTLEKCLCARYTMWSAPCCCPAHLLVASPVPHAGSVQGCHCIHCPCTNLAFPAIRIWPRSGQAHTCLPASVEVLLARLPGPCAMWGTPVQECRQWPGMSGSCCACRLLAADAVGVLAGDATGFKLQRRPASEQCKRLSSPDGLPRVRALPVIPLPLHPRALSPGAPPRCALEIRPAAVQGAAPAASTRRPPLPPPCIAALESLTRLPNSIRIASGAGEHIDVLHSFVALNFQLNFQMLKLPCLRAACACHVVGWYCVGALCPSRSSQFTG